VWQIRPKRFLPWPKQPIPRMIGFFSTTFPVRRWLASMQIDGEWLLCNDGIVSKYGYSEVTVRPTSPAGCRPLLISQVRERLAPPDWRGKGGTPSLGTWRTVSQGFLNTWQGRGQRCFIELIG